MSWDANVQWARRVLELGDRVCAELYIERVDPRRAIRDRAVLALRIAAQRQEENPSP